MRVSAMIVLCLAFAVPAHAQVFPIATPDSLEIESTADSIRLASQRDVSDLLRSILGRPVKTEASRQPKAGMSITLLPNGGYNPATGAFIGASIALGGWLGDPQTTTLSSGSLGLTFSEGGRISLQFKSDFYLAGN